MSDANGNRQKSLQKSIFDRFDDTIFATFCASWTR